MLDIQDSRGNTVLEALILVTLLLGIGMGGFYLFYFQPRQITKIDLKPTLGESSPPKPLVNPPTPKPTTKKVSPETTTTSKPSIQDVVVGTAFKLNSFEVTVTEAKNLGSTIGSKYSKKTTEGQYVIVNFAAKNTSSNAAALSELDFMSGSNTFNARIQDSAGRNYESTSLMWYDTETKNSIGYIGPLNNFSEIKPGFSTKFSLIYEVAADSKNMKVRVGDKGSVVARVSLGF